jgi:hypothetical protein
MYKEQHCNFEVQKSLTGFEPTIFGSIGGIVSSETEMSQYSSGMSDQG